MGEEPTEDQPVLTEPLTYSGGQRQPSFSFKKLLPVVLVVAGGLFLIGGGLSVYRRAISNRQEEELQPIPTPIEEATPTPEPEFDRAELKIQVLNGTGTPGVAGEAADFLENKGYQNVKTGNADSYEYDETIIQIKEEKADFLDQLRDDLTDEYVLAAETETLEEDADFDVIIILGAE